MSAPLPLPLILVLLILPLLLLPLLLLPLQVLPVPVSVLLLLHYFIMICCPSLIESRWLTFEMFNKMNQTWWITIRNKLSSKLCHCQKNNLSTFCFVTRNMYFDAYFVFIRIKIIFVTNRWILKKNMKQSTFTRIPRQSSKYEIASCHPDYMAGGERDARRRPRAFLEPMI